MIVFGGWNGSDFSHSNQVWALSLDASPTWTRLYPTGASPAVRKRAAAAYDPVGDRMIVFGGSNFTSSALGDLWALSLGPSPEWVRLFPEPFYPSARAGAKMVYDADENRIVMFGGWRPGGSIHDQYLNDTWMLSLGEAPEWLLISAGSPPLGRIYHGLVYDSSRDRLLVQDGYGPQCPQGCNPIYLGMFDDVQALTPVAGSPGAREGCRRSRSSWSQSAPRTAWVRKRYGKYPRRSVARGWRHLRLLADPGL